MNFWYKFEEKQPAKQVFKAYLKGFPLHATTRTISAYYFSLRLNSEALLDVRFQSKLWILQYFKQKAKHIYVQIFKPVCYGHDLEKCHFNIRVFEEFLFEIVCIVVCNLEVENTVKIVTKDEAQKIANNS